MSTNFQCSSSSLICIRIHVSRVKHEYRPHPNVFEGFLRSIILLCVVCYPLPVQGMLYCPHTALYVNRRRECAERPNRLLSISLLPWARRLLGSLATSNMYIGVLHICYLIKSFLFYSATRLRFSFFIFYYYFLHYR